MNLLKITRIINGKSQKEMANLLKISTYKYKKIESNPNIANMLHLKNMAKILNTSIEELTSTKCV